MKRKLVFISIISLPILLIFIADFTISKNTEKSIFNSTERIKKNKVGLVLGTAKTLQNGQINLYFKYRINATVELYKSGKIDFVLVSGDNSRRDYNEPLDFKNGLINKGIPESKIFLDYAGFRTLDSVIRAKEIFGQKSITIISQKFHNERSVYLAEKNGINAVAFNAKDVSTKYGFKTQLREYFARVKAFIDVILQIQPKFLGDKVEIN